jgi:hypothetical protein
LSPACKPLISAPIEDPVIEAAVLTQRADHADARESARAAGAQDQEYRNDLVRHAFHSYAIRFVHDTDGVFRKGRVT